MELHFHATCWFLKSYQCSHALDWFFTLVDYLPLEACWTSCNLFLWFYSCVKFILRWKLIDVKSSHDLILMYFVPNHFFNDLCLLWSFCGHNKMVWWQQKLFDGICHNSSLELMTKARACKGVGQEWSSVVTFHAPEGVGKCEGMNPTLPSELPLWKLESRWTFEFSKGDCKGSNSLDWKVPYTIEFFWELECLKWTHMTHLGI
jgi:hypothetical protein